MNRLGKELSVSNTETQKSWESLRVLPRFVGVWEGNWIRMDASAREIERYTAVLTQKIVEDRWVQTNENNFADGRTETINFIGRVVEDDTILLESPDFPYCNFKMLIQEHGDCIIIIRVWDKATEIPLATETINLVSENQRIRTMQQFLPPDGKLSGFMVIVEHKVKTHVA
jgi:hypothetical protein